MNTNPKVYKNVFYTCTCKGQKTILCNISSTLFLRQGVSLTWTCLAGYPFPVLGL